MVTPQALDQTIVMKRVFLTGASSGIGLAIAKLLVAHDHEVWGTSRNLERIPKMSLWHPVRLDLTDPLSVERALNAALAEAGSFDVVIKTPGPVILGRPSFSRQKRLRANFKFLFSVKSS